MAAEFITPIQPLVFGENTISAKRVSSADGGSAFKDMFSQLVGNVEEAERDLENKQYLLATGQIDDVHTVPIATANATLSVELLIAVRNKVVEAYKELMNISV